MLGKSLLSLLILIAGTTSADTLEQAARRHRVQYQINWTPKIAGIVTVAVSGNPNMVDNITQFDALLGLAPVWVTEGKTLATITVWPTDTTIAPFTQVIIFNYPASPTTPIPQSPTNFMVALAQPHRR